MALQRDNMSVVSSRRSDSRVPNQAASSLVTALESAGANLARLPGRAASSGLHEVKERASAAVLLSRKGVTVGSCRAELRAPYGGLEPPDDSG